MANGFSNWGSGGGGGGAAFSNWGGGGTAPTTHYGPLPTPKPSSGGSSWLGSLFHAVESTPVGQFVGFEHNVAQNLWRSPSKTGVGITQLPHALYAGPWALAKLAESQAREMAHHGIKGVLGGPLTYESWRTLLHDPHTLVGGAAVPLVQQYNNKYEIGNISKDLAFGHWGQLGHDIRLAGHHEEQDPLGTLLDLSVAGKAGGIAHLRAIERAAEAGKAPGAFGRLALSPRELVLRDFPDAPGVPVRLNYQAETSYGRVLQHQMDAIRFGRLNEEGVRVGGLPGQVTLLGHQIGLPFGAASGLAREDRRSRELPWAQDRQLVHAVRETYKDLPDDQVRAIVDVIAGHSRLDPDPIETQINFRERQIADHERIIAAAKKAGEKATVRQDITNVKALKVKVASLRALDKTAIYAENPKLQAAVEAIRNLEEKPTERAIAEGHLDPMQVEQRRFGEQKMMTGAEYKTKQVTGGEVVPDEVKIQAQKRARLDMAAALKERTKLRAQLRASWDQVIHHTQTRTLRNLHDEYVKRMRNLGHKAKTFRQYAEEVYPKRTQFGGAVSNALFKQEVLKDAERKANDAYIAARDEWQSRRPAMTASGKGRQHHTIATPQVVESAGLKGGTSYEDLAQQEADALQAYAEGRTEGHGPLAQYGPSFRAPHMPTVTDPALARVYTRAKAVLTRQSANEAWQTNKYVLWQRGMIANNPEVFTIDYLRQARWFATEDHFWKWVVPQSGQLDPKLALNGGKKDDEFYIKTEQRSPVPREPQQAAAFFHDMSQQADDALARAQHSYVTQDLQDAMKMNPKDESAAAWVARMNDAGIRRISGDVARTWQIDTRPSSLLRRIVLRNGVNQLWRFFLLGIKPAWSAANAMTNETLIAFRYLFTKGGGTAFYNSMVDTFGAAKAAEIIKSRLLHDTSGVGLINLRQFMQGDPRLADLFAGSFGKQLDRQLQHVGSMQTEWNRSIANRTARLLLPYTKDWGPVRLLRGFAEANYKFNIHAENAARAAAVQAEITRVTGKMVRTVEDLQDAMKSMKAEDFDKVRSGVLDAVGDYSNLGAFEREWIVTFAPFYPWFKTIMGITAKWVTRHPERLWGLGVMAHAFQQAQNKDYQLGIPLPYFAEDSIPAGKPQQGEQRIVTDRAFNPLVTPIDILNTAKSLTGDPNAQPSDLGLALLGPAAQFGYVALTGRDPFYGGTYSGPLSGSPALVRGAGSLLQTPQYRTIQQFGGIPGLVPSYKSKVYNTPKGGSFIPGLSEADMVAIEQYWGVPVRYANLQNLRTRALSEQGHPVSTTKPPVPSYTPPKTSSSGAFSNWGG